MRQRASLGRWRLPSPGVGALKQSSPQRHRHSLDPTYWEMALGWGRRTYNVALASTLASRPFSLALRLLAHSVVCWGVFSNCPAGKKKKTNHAAVCCLPGSVLYIRPPWSISAYQRDVTEHEVWKRLRVTCHFCRIDVNNLKRI